MAVIFLLSNEASEASNSRSGVIVDAIATAVNWPEEVLKFLTRKAAHIFAYFILGLLLYNALRLHVDRLKPRLVAAVVFCCLYAVSDEIHQLLIPGRSGEVRDVVIDTAAAAFGVMLCHKLSRK